MIAAGSRPVPGGWVLGVLVLLCPLLPGLLPGGMGAARADSPRASAERIQRDLEILCGAGARVVGSVALSAAMDHAEAELRRTGLQPMRETVAADRWDPGRTPVRLWGPQGVGPVFELTALGRSPALLPGRFELLDLGWGTPTEIEAASLRIPGRIVLVREGRPEGHEPLHRLEKLFRAGDAGATAVLFHHPEGLAFRGTVAWPDPARIPGLCLEEASGLLEALASGQSLQLEVLREGAVPPGPVRVDSSNLIGTLEGRADLASPLLLSAHLDAWDLGAGALDDAAGVAVALEAARLLAERDWSARRGLRLVLFTGEEFGLQGSRTHLAACEAGRFTPPALVLNLEMPEAPSGFVVYAGEGLPALLAPLLLQHRDLGLQAGVIRSPAPANDQLPFLLAGFPGLSLAYHRSEHAESRIHTQQDRLEPLDAGALARCAELVAAALWALSEPVTPLPGRLDEAQLEALFESWGGDLERSRRRGY